MRANGSTAVLILCCALVAPVGAEELLHLKSGAVMAIAAHEVRGEMIHVDLGSNGFMAFPMSMVERIEKAGSDVLLNPSFNTSNNIMTPSAPDPTRSYPVRGAALRRGNDGPQVLRPQDATPDPHVSYDEKMGVSVYRPTPHGSRAKRSLAFWGNNEILNRTTQPGEGPAGTTRVGNRYIVGNPAPRRSPHQQTVNLVGVAPRRGGAAPAQPSPPAEPPAGDESGGE